MLCFKLNAQKESESKDKEISIQEPKLVVPGRFLSPPSDAIVLFDGKDFTKWQHSKTRKPVKWKLNSDNSMTIKPGTGSIETKVEHESIQLHIEWKTPMVVNGNGQGRGNSGVYFQKSYEIQVLDSYNNVTYSNGQAASVYKQSVPLVNASKPPGEWQTYDIIFNEPHYDKKGNRLKKGSFTVFHNGVLVQNNVDIQGTTEYRGNPKLRDIKIPKRLYLQDHGDPVSYRNIWLRKL